MSFNLCGKTIAENKTVSIIKDVKSVYVLGRKVWEKVGWECLFSGSVKFTQAGSFNVSGLKANDIVEITADSMFVELVSGSSPQTTTLNSERARLPFYAQPSYASVYYTVSENNINFQFNRYDDNFKGIRTIQFPVGVTITEVWRKK